MRQSAGTPDEGLQTGRVVLVVGGERVPLEPTVPAAPVSVERLPPILRGLSSLFAERATTGSRPRAARSPAAPAAGNWSRSRRARRMRLPASWADTIEKVALEADPLPALVQIDASGWVALILALRLRDETAEPAANREASAILREVIGKPVKET